MNDLTPGSKTVNAFSPISKLAGRGAFVNRGGGDRVISDINRIFGGNAGGGGPVHRGAISPCVWYQFDSPVPSIIGAWYAKAYAEPNMGVAADIVDADLGTLPADPNLIVWVIEEFEAGARVMKAGDRGAGYYIQVDAATQLPIALQLTHRKEVFWGSATGTLYVSGATIDLNPCDIHGTLVSGASAVTVYVQPDQSSYTMLSGTNIPNGTRIPYEIDSAGDYYVFGDGVPGPVMVTFQIDGATKKYQMKQKDTWGTFSGSVSDWIDIITGAACGDT